MLAQPETRKNSKKGPAKINKQWLVMTLCGLFVSATTVIDWYWNEPHNILPFSEEEYLRYPYLYLIVKPIQVIATPDLTAYWWMVVLVAGWMFILGFTAAKIVITIYQSRFIATQNVYLKTIAIAGLIIGLSAGYFLLIAAYMLPLVWKIYLSIVTAMLTFLGTYLVFRSPYRMYLWWKTEKVLHLMSAPAKVFTELGYGNPSFISTEVELPDGREYRQAGFVRIWIEGVYLRIWLGTRVFILSSQDGLKMQRKDRKAIKMLVGIQGRMATVK
jgi:uncharacterized protein DUF3977